MDTRRHYPLYPGAYCTYTPPYGWLDSSEAANEFLNETCMWEEVKLDVDDKRQFDPYYRILAVVYVNDTNLNEKLVREGYAEVMYVPPSEFDSYVGKVDYTPSPTQTPGFEFLFAIICVVAAMCLVRQKG